MTQTNDKPFMSVADAHASTGLTIRLLKAALHSGELEGKNFKGRKGWMTTSDALKRWIEKGNKGGPAPAKEGERVD